MSAVRVEVRKAWAIAHPSDGALLLDPNGFPSLWTTKARLKAARTLAGGFKAIRVTVSYKSDDLGVTK